MCWSLGSAVQARRGDDPGDRQGTNVELVSLKEPGLDTIGPFREPLLAIMAWVAQYESERRSERTRTG